MPESGRGRTEEWPGYAGEVSALRFSLPKGNLLIDLLEYFLNPPNF
jgi:hypothetical protein